MKRNLLKKIQKEFYEIWRIYQPEIGVY
jgi:hypothetical protein